MTLLQANPSASDGDIRQAEASQPLEFPRGADTEVPEAIRMASYEIAHSLLDGKDPEMELENLGIVSQGFGSVRTAYNRSQVPIEHIINGIPSAAAWRLLKPFLRDDEAIKLSRISYVSRNINWICGQDFRPRRTSLTPAWLFLK